MEAPGGLAITLLVSLSAALVLGTVAHRLGLAPMIGYVAAGLIVGPFTPGFVADRAEVLALADIGVALLMFSIGLRFKLSELASVGRLALFGTPVQVAITLAIGFGAAVLLGAEPITAAFIGGVASISSSVVLVKIAGEESLQATLHGRIAMGWTVAQDLITVVLVVILAALAGGESDPLVQIARSVALALAFVAAVLVIGSRVLPRVLAEIARLGSRELFIVAVAVVAIGTSFLAGLLGVSVALGAFLAGLALAESDLAASVLGEVVPLRELFATLFFVSVGLLLQPSAVAEGWLIVAALLVLITVGKALPIAGLSVLGGQRPAPAFRAGGLLAQSGEFSFVIATLGLQQGALPSGTFSQAMGAVVISILLAGPTAAAAARIGERLERRRQPDTGTAATEGAEAPHRHALILGYGRVGRTVARILEARGFPYVAVDADYPLVRAAAARGHPVIYGEAGTPAVLDEAGIAEARILVVAVPDALATRQAITYARFRNARIEIVARAHSEAEELALRHIGVERVVLAERQVGNELVRHALRRYGISEREVDAILRRDE
jgi:CPA2 family monovalent cation:H+ antiporter-2